MTRKFPLVLLVLISLLAVFPPVASAENAYIICSNRKKTGKRNISEKKLDRFVEK